MSTLAELEALLAQARGGTLKPLVLVYGDQEHLVRQAYDRLLEALVPEDARDFNLEQHDGAQVEALALASSLNTPPLLAGPKAVGVYDARFFQSKANSADLLAKARDRWAANDTGPALRALGRVLSLAPLSWDEAASAGPDALAEALDLSPADMARLGGDWLNKALAQAQSQALAQPSGGDDSGDLCQALEAQLAQGPAVATLVCACSSADARKRLTKLFLEKGQVLDFRSAEKGPQANLTARAFLAQALKQRGLTLKPALGERLASAYGHNLGLLERELEKLEAHAFPRTELLDEDLGSVGSPRPEEDVFKLLDALGRKDLGAALKLLRRQLDLEPDAKYQIFGLLSGELRRLQLCRALLDEGRLGGRAASDYNSFKMQVHPKLAKELPPALAAWWKRSHAYGLYQSILRAKSFDGARLRSLVLGLAKADLAMKTGQADPQAVLEDLCLALCGVQQEALL